MINLLIVDDEAPARSRLRRMVERVPDCAVVAEADSGDAALEQLERHTPDLLLLDISMPGLDGMSLARRLRAQDPAPLVVFCTAWPDRALDAFDCDAVDYLLKPVRQERLEAALDKVRRMLPEERGPAGQEKFLRATVGGSTVLIPVDRIACLLAEDKYTTVFHDDGKSVVNNSLVELEADFPDRFLRVHRNALVAQDRVRGLERGHGGVMCVTLEGCELRPQVSRRQLPAVRRLLRESS